MHQIKQTDNYVIKNYANCPTVINKHDTANPVDTVCPQNHNNQRPRYVGEDFAGMLMCLCD